MTEREQHAIEFIQQKLKELEQIHAKALDALNAVQGRDQVHAWKRDTLEALQGKLSDAHERQLRKDWIETSYIVGDLFDELSDDVDMCRRHLRRLMKDIQTNGLPEQGTASSEPQASERGHALMNAPKLPYPRKRFGQHFLIDHNIVNKICARAAIQPGDTVLEIGPGRGILTSALCRDASRVIAVEVDADLVTLLRNTLGNRTNLELHHGDALKYPYHALPAGTVVVANLPYNISTPLMFQLFDVRPLIHRMVLMLQLEVAQRMVAKVGTRDYGVLAVLCQYFADVSLAFKVPRTCFHPRPAVMSAVVELQLTDGRQAPDPHHTAAFTTVVRAAFSHRRKTLFNAMRDAGLATDALSTGLRNAGIDPKRRAETLSIPEFELLTKYLLDVGAVPTR